MELRLANEKRLGLPKHPSKQSLTQAVVRKAAAEGSSKLERNCVRPVTLPVDLVDVKDSGEAPTETFTVEARIPQKPISISERNATFSQHRP
jgi:hypothetical protein